MNNKNKQTRCVSSEFLQHFSHQLTILKQIGNHLKETTLQIDSQRIIESVKLMETKILFMLDDKPLEQYTDFVIDFYESTIGKLRNQLHQTSSQCKKIEMSLDAMKKKSINDEILNQKEKVDMNAVNQIFVLKNQLAHSQQILKQNQLLMSEQNTIIEQLNQYAIKAQQRETLARSTLQAKIFKFDQMVNQNQLYKNKFIKDFEIERKKYEKEVKQLQITSTALFEEKDRLEAELSLKIDEIKLLSKKVYDQNLIILKFERSIEEKHCQLMEERVDLNRSSDEAYMLKQKLKSIDKEFEHKINTQQDSYIALQQKFHEMLIANKQAKKYQILYEGAEAKISELQKCQIKLKQRHQQDMQVLEREHEDFIKERKMFTKKQKQNQHEIQILKENLLELEQSVSSHESINSSLKLQIKSMKQSFYLEKEEIQKEIYQQFKSLAHANSEILQSLKKMEKDGCRLSNEKEQLLVIIKKYEKQFQILNQKYQEMMNMTNIIEKEKYLLRDELEAKGKQCEKHVKEIKKIRAEIELQSKTIEELASIQQSYQLKIVEINSITAQLEESKIKFDKIQIENKATEKEEIKTNKEEICKKQFQIKQLTNKVHILQEEIRQNDKLHEIEKAKTADKIEELENIIQERFDLTNRLLESSVL